LGAFEPGDRVTVTRTGAGGSVYGAAETDGVGFFWTLLWGPTGQPQHIAHDDVIEIYVNGTEAATIPVSGVAGAIDVLADQVVGSITGDNGGTPVTLTVGVDGAQPSADAPRESAVTDASGAFTATFTSVDLGAGTLVAVEYPSAGHIVRSYLYPAPRSFAVQNANTILGYATPGQPVTVTVHAGAGPTVRWSACGVTALPYGFYQIAKD